MSASFASGNTIERLVCARAISSRGFGSALTKSTTVFGTESGLLGNVSFSLIQSALPRQSAFFNYELRKPSRASEHERLRLGLHRWWFHRVREGTTDVTDDTNVWRMNQGENHDAEILSVTIRLKRIVRDHELETLLEIIRC